MAELFRRVAIERLSSPEQLDKAITVSRPVSWIALFGVTIIIVAAIVWWFVFDPFPAGAIVNEYCFYSAELS